MYKVTINNNGHETVIHSPYFNVQKLVAGQIKQAINIADGFTFTILPNNDGYNLLRPLTTLITVDNMKTGKREFDGRVLIPTEDMSNDGAFAKSYLCESELGFLNDSKQRHGEYHDITVRDFLQVIIDNHNADIADDEIDKTFEVGIVEVDSSTGTLYRYLGYENTMDTIKDKLLDRLGGELRVVKRDGIRYLDYLWSIGEQKSTEIRIAKNLDSITKEVDPTEYFTRIIPLGQRIESEDEDATDASEARLTIESVNDGKDYLIDHETEQSLGTIVVGTQVWDDVATPSTLKLRGEQWLAEQNRMKVQHKLTALDLSILGVDSDAYEVGNWHPVINPVMHIDENLRIVGKTTDIIEPENNDLTIGDQFKRASDYQFEAQQAEKKVVQLESIVERQSGRISSVSVDLKTAKQELEATKQQLENYESITDQDIIAITNSIDSILNSIQQLESLIEDIQGIVTEQEITQMKNDILTNKNNIVTLTNDLLELTTRVENLENS